MADLYDSLAGGILVHGILLTEVEQGTKVVMVEVSVVVKVLVIVVGVGPPGTVMVTEGEAVVDVTL